MDPDSTADQTSGFRQRLGYVMTKVRVSSWHAPLSLAFRKTRAFIAADSFYDDNDFYGHAQILRTYCGVSGHPGIPGRLQHGWYTDFGFGEPALADPRPKLVWSRRIAQNCALRRVERVVPIGAPFLYLPKPADAVPSRGLRSLLVMPFHGWEKEHLHGNMGTLTDAIGALEREGFGPISICLYWLEYGDPAIRKIFEDRGWGVFTNGHRDKNPRFHFTQRDLMLSHAYVTSNRVCTAAFYALGLQRKFFLHGPPMGLAGSADPTGETFDRWQRETYPELLWERFSDTCHAHLADRELGRDVVLSPESMRELFWWTPFGRTLRSLHGAKRRVWAKLRSGAK